MEFLVSLFKKLDKYVLNIMHIGLTLSFLLSIIAIIILLTYNLVFSLPLIFYLGITLLKCSMIFAVFFIICAIGFNSLIIK